jgi:hypothetical protein
MPARTIIVGDIHGMHAELVALVTELGLTKDDVLVSAGDIVDKGPESAKAVAYLRELRDEGYNVIVVKGNHEDKHERFRVALARGGEKAAMNMKGAEELAAINADLSPEDVAFIESAVIYHRIPEHNALVVHAGIMPTLEELPALDEYAAMSRKDQAKFDRVLRVRHVTGKAVVKYTIEFTYEGDDYGSLSIPELAKRARSAKPVKSTVRPAGSFIALGEEGGDDPFWAEVYDGRFGHVYFGHSPDVDGPMQFAHATGLDTGAVFGGKLTAVILDPGTAEAPLPSPRYVSVQASGKFCKTLWED